MISFSLVLPIKISTNRIYAGMHWAVRKQHADLFHMHLLSVKPKKIPAYPVQIVYDFTFKSRPLDTLNCAYMAKMLEDGMVKRGIIKADDPAYVSLSSIRSKKGGSDQVTITINNYGF